MIIVWIVVLAAALVLEAATFALISVWFAFGAAGALIAASAGASVTVQLLIFTVLTGLLLFLTRPFLKKLFPTKFTPTNSEREIGRTAVVTEKINNVAGSGRILLGGVNWAAVSADGEEISEGEIVTVTEIRSAKLAVKRSVTNPENGNNNNNN